MEPPSSFDLCIPAHNEEAVILATVKTLSDIFGRLSVDGRLVVAENGSTDGTAQAIEDAHLSNVGLLRVPAPGKGGAILDAARRSQADLFGFIDADLSADPNAIPQMIALLEQGTDIVVASRLMKNADVHRRRWRRFCSFLYNGLRDLFFRLPVRDSQCGLKIMNARGRDVLRSCRETGWFLDVEFLARAQRDGLTIKEIPVPWEEFRYRDRKGKLFVWRDGWRAISAFVRIRQHLKRD